MHFYCITLHSEHGLYFQKSLNIFSEVAFEIHLNFPRSCDNLRRNEQGNFPPIAINFISILFHRVLLKMVGLISSQLRENYSFLPPNFANLTLPQFHPGRAVWILWGFPFPRSDISFCNLVQPASSSLSLCKCQICKMHTELYRNVNSLSFIILSFLHTPLFGFSSCLNFSSPGVPISPCILLFAGSEFNICGIFPDTSHCHI